MTHEFAPSQLPTDVINQQAFRAPDPNFVPYLERPEVQLEIRQDANRLRTREAIETSVFIPTPELSKGVESHYNRHFELNELLDTALAPQETTEPMSDTQKQHLETIIGESGFTTELFGEKVNALVTRGGINKADAYAQMATPLLAATMLARSAEPNNPALRRAEIMAMANATRSLYAEASVGVTSLSDVEKQRVIDKHAQVQKLLSTSGLFTYKGKGEYSVNDLSKPGSNNKVRFHDQLHDNPLAAVEKAEQTFWGDTRFAGQLLFHASANFKNLRMNNVLATRRMQHELHGSMYINTTDKSGLDADGNELLWSPTVHFSETYDTKNYYRGEPGKGYGGTIALPLAEIIQQSPYGRDARYGILQLRPDFIESIIPKVVVVDGVGSPGAGDYYDAQGKVGKDRSFYAKAEDTGSNVPVEDAPDGYSYKLGENGYALTYGDEAEKRNYHIGSIHNVAPDVSLPHIAWIPGETHDEAFWARYKANEAALADTIRQLQHDSIRKFGNQIVVPLEAGVMKFNLDDDNYNNGKPGGKFARMPTRHDIGAYQTRAAA